MKAPVSLAHEPAFRIGPLEVLPSTRELVRGDRRAVVEPRVMQVLVVLSQAGGAVVGRDDLVERCWDGRIVGDDAINRVLSLLRRLSEDIARDVFRVETVTKVGYRLMFEDANAPSVPSTRYDSPAPAPPAPGPKVNRRTALAGAAAIAAAGGGFWALSTRRPGLSLEARSFLDRGLAALRNDTPEENAAAVAALRRSAELAPDHVEPWGALAIAYVQSLVFGGSRDRERLSARGQAAISRALALDPDCADALAARACFEPSYRDWLAFDARCTAVLDRFPDHVWLLQRYGHFLRHTGRNHDALIRLDRGTAIDPAWPRLAFNRAASLAALGRLDEADAAIEQAHATWPRHYAIWFFRLNYYAATGRADVALAMIADRDSHPVGVADWNIALCAAEAKARSTRARADIEAAWALYLPIAHRRAGFCENAIPFAASSGRIDDAFALIDGYFFGRGFDLGETRFGDEMRMSNAPAMRVAGFLFTPDCAPLRRDPRFGPVVRGIGLEDYWRKSGKLPDYRRV